MLRKIHRDILIFSAAVFLFTFLCLEISAAEEKWQVITWDDGPAFMAGFDALCLESGLTSFDVLQANGYPGSGKIPPLKGDELLVPNSKGDLFDTWTEVQNRNGGSRPLVTIKLHGVPNFARGAAQTTQTEKQPAVSAPPEESSEDIAPVPAPAKPAGPVEPEDMEIVVSDDKIVQQTSGGRFRDRISLIFDQAAASRDLIITDPPVLKPMTTPPPVTQDKMIWPVSGEVSSGFGRRGGRNHDGIDIPMPKGTPIAAALGGVVLDTAANGDKNYSGYGSTVVIDHGNGIVTLYAHCSKLNVKKGQEVRQGEIVAFVGNTGRTTTHHVHFEVRKEGRAVNPIPYLIPR